MPKIGEIKISSSEGDVKYTADVMCKCQKNDCDGGPDCLGDIDYVDTNILPDKNKNQDSFNSKNLTINIDSSGGAILKGKNFTIDTKTVIINTSAIQLPNSIDFSKFKSERCLINDQQTLFFDESIDFTELSIDYNHRQDCFFLRNRCSTFKIMSKDNDMYIS